jgi:Uma2 family endonuclease
MSAIARPRPTRYTFDDFCLLVKDGQKADLIDGVIYMSSPDNTDANTLFCWLLSLLTFFVNIKKLGRVYGNRVAFRLDDFNSPEPDVGFVKRSRLHLVKRGHVAGGPDAAFEIVSPESVERDYERKRRQFEDARVSEYWIIDEIEQRVTLLRLGKDGKYRSIPATRGVFRSKVIRGFWLRERWLWEKSLPDPLKTLTAILRGGK